MNTGDGIPISRIFEATNELISAMNDPVFGLEVLIIMLTVFAALAFGTYVVKLAMPHLIDLLSTEKRKNSEDSFSPFNEKPKNDEQAEESQWVVGDDGELVQRKVQR